MSPPDGSRAAAAPAPGVAWDTLEQLLRALQRCEDAREQVRLVLHALRDGLQADAVFHWDGAGAVEVVGSCDAASCQAFAQAMVSTHAVDGQGQLLLPPLEAPAPGPPQHIRGAALLRLGQAGPGWLGALSVDGQRVFDTTDLKIMLLTRRMLLTQRHSAGTYGRLKEALLNLVHCLTAAIDARDPYTCGHSERVARIAGRLGRQMGLSQRLQGDLYLAGLLHDIGKIGIRDDVLLKKGKLTDDEFEHMKQHPVIGDEIVKRVKELGPLRSGVRHHHERMDGGGYPDGLEGDAVPLLARVLAVADACDAMMSSRPYRDKRPTQEIDAIIAAGAGTHWDADVVSHFMACRQELYAMCQRGLGHTVELAVQQVLDQDGRRLGLSSIQTGLELDTGK